LGSASEPGYRSLTLDQFAAAVGSAAPTPASGSVAAVALGLAGALCAKCARLSTRQMSDALAVAERADALAGWAAALADTDARAYEDVVAARDAPARDDALARAADAPLDVARVASWVAELAARLAQFGNPNLRGDAVTAAQLAAACATSCARLVAINLAGRRDDARLGEVEDYARAAREHSARASAR
jgi:formiminotetrahydrofolate cyclodeaminase